MSEHTSLYVELFTKIHAAGGYPDVDELVDDIEVATPEVKAEKPHRSVYLFGNRLTISRGSKRREYQVDRYPVTESSASRLARVLNTMNKTVELDMGFTPAIFFHS